MTEMVTSARKKTEGSGGKRPSPLLFLSGLLALLLLLPIADGLVISDFRSGNTLLCLPLADGEQFSIRFTHSVNLSDVTDLIARDGRQLVCRSTQFWSYGAGIPDLADGIGTTFSMGEDGFVLSGIDKVQETIPILLQTVPHHRLLYRGRQLDLLERFGSGTLIELRMQRVSIASLLLCSDISPAV